MDVLELSAAKFTYQKKEESTQAIQPLGNLRQSIPTLFSDNFNSINITVLIDKLIKN